MRVRCLALTLLVAGCAPAPASETSLAPGQQPRSSATTLALGSSEALSSSSSATPPPAPQATAKELRLPPEVVPPPEGLAQRPLVFLRIEDPEGHLTGGSGLRECIVYDDGLAIRKAGQPARVLQGKVKAPSALRDELLKTLQHQPTSQSLTRRRHEPFLTMMLDTDRGWISFGVYGITPEGEPSTGSEGRLAPTAIVDALAALRTLEILQPRPYVARHGQVVLQADEDCEVGLTWPTSVPVPDKTIPADAKRVHYPVDAAVIPVVTRFQKGLRSRECALLHERKWTMRAREIYPAEDYLEDVRDVLDARWEQAERATPPP